MKKEKLKEKMHQKKIKTEKANRLFKPKLKKRKMKKIKVNETKDENSITLRENMKPSHTLQLQKVMSSVSALLNLYGPEKKSNSVSLFQDDCKPVYMTVKCIKAPEMNTKHFRFILPHSMVDSSSDVCLFVSDLKKGKKIDHEPTIEHYKNILEINNVTEVSQIIPVRQIQVEYNQFELKRRLVGQFDFFLSDGPIAGHILGLLGKEIYKRRKIPVPVNFRAKNLKEQFEQALSKTTLSMSGHTVRASLKIGHTKHSVEQLAENILAVAAGLAEYFPGGWANVRSLHIHLQESREIPVYISLKSSNEVPVPVISPKRPKKAVPVEGELSTFPGTHVTVLPSGDVIVKKMRTKEDEEMGISDSDWEASDEEMDTDPANDSLEDRKDNLKAESLSGSDDEDANEAAEEDDEDATEAAEKTYLSGWRKQRNAFIEEDSKKKKKEKAATTPEYINKQKSKTNKKSKKMKKEKLIEDVPAVSNQLKRSLQVPQSEAATTPGNMSKQKTRTNKKSKKMKKEKLIEDVPLVSKQLKRSLQVPQSEAHNVTGKRATKKTRIENNTKTNKPKKRPSKKKTQQTSWEVS